MFVFRKIWKNFFEHRFWDLPFCLITGEYKIGENCKNSYRLKDAINYYVVYKNIELKSSGSVFCTIKVFFSKFVSFLSYLKHFFAGTYAANSTRSFSYFQAKISLLCFISFILLEMQLFWFDVFLIPLIGEHCG